jgi:hypothetical protein
MRRADAVATVRIPAYVRLLPDHQRRTVLRPWAADWFPTFRIRLRGWGGETCEPDFIPTDSFHLHIFRSANRKLQAHFNAREQQLYLTCLTEIGTQRK